MGSPWRLREGFATSSRALYEDVAGAEGFEKPPRRLREGFSHTHGGSAKASRRRHGRLRLETIREIMTSPPFILQKESKQFVPEEVVVSLAVFLPKTLLKEVFFAGITISTTIFFRFKL